MARRATRASPAAGGQAEGGGIPHWGPRRRGSRRSLRPVAPSGGLVDPPRRLRMRRILNPSVQRSHRITGDEDDTNSDWGDVLAERPPEQTPARRSLRALIRWFPDRLPRICNRSPRGGHPLGGDETDSAGPLREMIDFIGENRRTAHACSLCRDHGEHGGCPPGETAKERVQGSARK